MAEFHPFRAVLPSPDITSRVVTRPFDNYSPEQVTHITASNPDSFLNVIAPALGADESVTFTEKLYLGKQVFESLTERGIYHQEETPGYYLYIQEKDGETFCGLVGVSSIDDSLKNVIKPHEQTLENKEVRLKEYLDIIDINAEPVFLTFPGGEKFDAILEECRKITPKWTANCDFTGKVSVIAISEKSLIEKIYSYFKSINSLYIADGHHRSASSVFFGEASRTEHPGYTGKEAFNYYLTIIFPENASRLYEFNRLITDLEGITPEILLDKISLHFDIFPDRQLPLNGEITLFISGKWYALHLKKEKALSLEEQKQLPAHILSDLILAPILNITDIRKDKRIRFKGGKTDIETIEQLVNSGKFACAFCLPPVPPATFRRFADMGWFMPPKSTWFEPKLLNGYIIYRLSDTSIHDYTLS